MTTVQIINATLQIWGSLISVLMALCLHYAGRFRIPSGRLYRMMLMCNAGSMLFDVFALFLRGHSGQLVTVLLWLTNTVSFVCDILILPTFIQYLLVYLQDRGAEVKYDSFRIVCFISGLLLLVVIINPIYPLIFGIDQNNLYYRGKFFLLTSIDGVIGLLVAICLVIKYRRSLLPTELLALSSYILVPFLSVPLQACFYGLAFINIGNTLSLTLIYLVLQVHQARRIAAQENVLLQSRYTTALNQIQPHYLFSALNSIQDLCKVDPQQAGSVINSFAKYFRVNMDSLTCTEPILLEEDINHLENYLRIEQFRIPNITVEYDLKATDFRIPPLTLQPLVENAIKYGISHLKEGGKIMISSWEGQDAYYLEVKDNGGGFVKEPQYSDDEFHRGIPNTRTRIELMCHGQLLVTNRPGDGVTVHIQIPKECV